MLKRLYTSLFGTKTSSADKSSQKEEECAYEDGLYNLDQEFNTDVRKRRKVVSFADQKRDQSIRRQKERRAVQSPEIEEDEWLEEELQRCCQKDSQQSGDSDSQRSERLSEEQEEDSSYSQGSSAHGDSQSCSESDRDEQSDNEQSLDSQNVAGNGTISLRRLQKQQTKAAKKSPKKQQNEARSMVESASVNMSSIKRTLNQSFKEVDDLNCPICMDYIVSCRTAICGHSFCEICIHESLIHRKECPNCRKDIRKWVLSKSSIVDSAVQLMVKSKSDADDSELKRYQERVKAHQEWLDKQQVKDVRPGDKVDALDTEYIWCKAQVELKIRAKGRQPLLYLHYDGWSRKYDEYIYMDSRRVAPEGIFTGRVDIPRYQSNGAGRQPMNYAQVIDSARNMQLNQDQIENAEQRGEQIDINGPDLAQQLVEEIHQDNDGSFNSDQDQNRRGEPEPERSGEQSSRPHGSRINASTSLNRDSVGGRAENQAQASTTRHRPVSRSSRIPSWAFQSEIPPLSSVLGQSPYFRVSSSSQAQPSTDPFRPARTVGPSNPFRSSLRTSHATSRQRAEGAAAAQGPSSHRQSTVNRSPFLLGNSATFQFSTSGQNAGAQTNNGDAQGTNGRQFLYPESSTSPGGQPWFRRAGPASQAPRTEASQATGQRADVREGGAEGRLQFTIQHPNTTASRAPNQLQRRLSMPSNTGNVMRGANQSNNFGATQTLNSNADQAQRTNFVFGSCNHTNSQTYNRFQQTNTRQQAQRPPLTASTSRRSPIFSVPNIFETFERSSPCNQNSGSRPSRQQQSTTTATQAVQPATSNSTVTHLAPPVPPSTTAMPSTLPSQSQEQNPPSEASNAVANSLEPPSVNEIGQNASLQQASDQFESILVINPEEGEQQRASSPQQAEQQPEQFSSFHPEGGLPAEEANSASQTDARQQQVTATSIIANVENGQEVAAPTQIQQQQASEQQPEDGEARHSNQSESKRQDKA